MQLVTSTALSMSLQSAIELGVFDIIAKAGASLSSAEITARGGTNNAEGPTMLDRILRLLANHSVVDANDHDVRGDEPKFKRVYSLAPVSKYFMKSGEEGVSLGPLMTLIQDKVFMKTWFQLKGPGVVKVVGIRMIDIVPFPFFKVIPANHIVANCGWHGAKLLVLMSVGDPIYGKLGFV